MRRQLADVAGDGSAIRGERPDVLTYVSEPLKEPMKLSGEPIVHLMASTSGTDSDWVVKLIDVYPDMPEIHGP